jgi:hypothetical protein
MMPADVRGAQSDAELRWCPDAVPKAGRDAAARPTGLPEVPGVIWRRWGLGRQT